MKLTLGEVKDRYFVSNKNKFKWYGKWTANSQNISHFYYKDCQKEDAKSAHMEKRAKNEKIEISGLMFMLTT